jgi:exonuclease SbcC
MKILAIRLRNLASIEALDVDFTAEPLRSAGIFAISGPTGSGKSTILDALCLALYDKTPRFASTAESVAVKDVAGGTINQADVKNILRRGTSEGFAEADFRGIDGNIYRSRWSVRRARGKATGTLQSQTMQVSNLTTGAELQGTRKELLAQLVVVIGLSYEQFTRTVLLAQNDFATFLKSREADKAELLEKLTGTDIYSRISREVYRRNKMAREELQLIKTQMEQVNVMTAEQVEELKGTIATLSAAHKAEQERWRQLNGQQTVVRRYEAQQKGLEAKLKERESCSALVAQAAKEHESCSSALSDLKQKWEALRPELLKAREQDVRLQTMSRDLQQLSDQTRQGEARLADAEKRGAQLAAERTKCATELEKLSEGRDAQQLFDEQKGALTAMQEERNARWKSLEAINIKEVNETTTRVTAQRESLRQALTALAELADLSQRLAVLTEESGRVESDLKAQQLHFASVKQLYENAQLTVSKSVKSLRNELVEGMACPVCGSTQHPYADHSEVAETLFNSIKQQYDEAVEQGRALSMRKVQIDKDIEFNKRQTSERQRLLAAYGEENRRRDWLEARIVEAESQLKALDEQTSLHQRLSRELQVCDTRMASARRHNELLHSAIEAHRLAEQRCLSFAEQVELLKRSVAETRARQAKSESEIAELRRERATLLKGRPADEAEQAVTRREKELTAAVDNAREAMNRGNAQLSGIAGEVKQMEEECGRLRTEYAAIEHPEALDATIAECLKRGSELSDKLSAAKAQLVAQQENEAKVKSLTAQLEERQKVAKNWSILNDCIGSADGKAFKVIAQSYTLKLLLLHANKHLSTLSRRYRLLQVPDTLALQVIDRDMCDEVRTVYSLSGGESFLISLALALGLSSLSGNGLKVESLFIDEGFGSLDADSLRIAMEALEMLQNQGRKIGVISHVQEMSDRISVQIRLQKCGNGKSEVYHTS